MKIALAFPTLPPALDGIGDYTALLAETLAEHCEVEILTGSESPSAIPAVGIRPGVSFNQIRGPGSVAAAVDATAPDWLILQYNPFSYGTYGFNAKLPLALWHLRFRRPSTRLAVMIHEPFVPREDWKFAVMSTWQRLQFMSLGKAADVLFFSIEPWVQIFQSWFPHTPAYHLPVGSNIPNVDASPRAARLAFDLPADAFVLGVFGSAHPSRLLPFIRAATEAVQRSRPVHVLYVGPSGATVRDVLGPHIPLTDTGPLPAEDVSRAFAAMDLYLSPFRKGLSTRRGSFMPALQHGRPSLSTRGVHTDEMLHRQNRDAFVLTDDTDVDSFSAAAVRLASDPDARSHLGATGQTFFETHFAWPVIAGNLLERLSAAGADPRSPASSVPLEPHSPSTSSAR